MVDPVLNRGAGLTPTTLRIVRYAMLAGVLLFGAVSIYEATKRSSGEAPTSLAWTLRLVGDGLCILVVLMWKRWERAPASARPTLGLIASALAAGAAMIGAVVILLAGFGGIHLYGLGLIVFFSTWAFSRSNPEAVEYAQA